MGRLEHVLWVGGPPLVGKTTVARRLARRHGLRLYSSDTMTWVHRDRAIRAASAAALRWESLAPAERWGLGDRDLLEGSLHAERGGMVIDDLRSLPTSPLVIAEGTVLPAWAASSGLVDRRRVIWLLPAPGLHRSRLVAAGLDPGPRRLYRLLTDVIAREAATHDLPALRVDASAGPAEVCSALERHFSGALAAGPRARTAEERRGLLREINEAIVGQVRGYYGRRWAEGDPDVVTQTFVCECARPACLAEVERTVGEAASGPVLAPGHDPVGE